MAAAAGTAGVGVLLLFPEEGGDGDIHGPTGVGGVGIAAVDHPGQVIKGGQGDSPAAVTGSGAAAAAAAAILTITTTHHEVPPFKIAAGL